MLYSLNWWKLFCSNVEP